MAAAGDEDALAARREGDAAAAPPAATDEADVAPLAASSSDEPTADSPSVLRHTRSKKLSADGLLDAINAELLRLRAAANELALLQTVRESDRMLRDIQKRLNAAVRLDVRAWRGDAGQRFRRANDRVSESLRDTQERLRDTQSTLLQWQKRRLSGIFEPVPLSVPYVRRRQTFAVFVWSTLFVFPGLLLFIALSVLLLLCNSTALLMLLYGFWIFTFDRDAAEHGRWPPRLRSWCLWTHMRDFFPAALVKTAELDASKRYIFAVHPHGVISIGAFLNLATDATGFSRAFPGIRVRLCTLASNFYVPIGREIILQLGMVSASRDTFRTLCDDSQDDTRGNAVAVVVGGAAEALEAYAGEYRLFLGRRKGFIRMALETGAGVVPVMSFGENNLYTLVHNPRGSRLRRFQELMERLSGVAPVLFHGRGAFNYAFGLLPFRRPIVTVVGAPIDVPKYAGRNVYTDEEGIRLTDEYHERYVHALRNLFENHVRRYDEDYKSFIVS